MNTNIQKHVRLILVIVLLGVIVAFPLFTFAGAGNDPVPPDVITVPLRKAATSGEFVPGHVLVRFKTGVKAEEAQGLLARRQLTVIGQIEAIGVQLLAVSPGSEMAVSKRLRADPQVAYAEPDYIYRALTVPDDPYYSTYQWNMPQINAESGWDITTGSSGVTIAILDTGVDVSHPDLSSKVVSGYDFVNGDRLPLDDEGHGTHVAGIAAAIGNNSEGVAGISWGANIMPVKVLGSSGSGSLSDVSSGITWAADHGAQIINMSLGSSSASSTLEDAINYAYGKGVLLVAAAGNECDSGNPTMYPAAYDHVLAVGATGDSDEHADYSSTGSYVDVVAPGGNPSDSYDSNPNHWIVSTYWRDSGYSYAQVAGTSQAAPHVAGLAALILSVNSSLSNDEVEQIIETTAVDLGTAGRDNTFGYGRIDVAAALTAAQAATTTPTPTGSTTPTTTTTPTPTGSTTPTTTTTPTPTGSTTPTTTTTPTPTGSVTPTVTATPTPTGSITPTATRTPRRPVGNIPVNDHVSGATQGQPDIATDLLGNAMVVWTDDRRGSDDIFSAVLPFRVHLWSSDVRADDGPAGTIQRGAAIAIDRRGRAIAVWVDDRSGDPDIYWAKRSAGAGSWTPGGRVNDVTTGAQLAPDIVIDRWGNVYAVWEDHRNGANNPDIYFAAMPLTASGWSASQLVNDSPIARQTRPALAVDHEGNLYAVWSDNRGGNPDIYIAKRPKGGSVWTAGVRVNDVTSGQQINPDVAVDGLDSVHVVWEDYRNGLHDPDIYASTLVSGSTSWRAGCRINDDAGHLLQKGPAIAATRHGSVYAVWADKRNGNLDIYFSILRLGNGWSANSKLNDDMGGRDQDEPSIASDPDGNAYVVWRDFRNASTGPDIIFAFLSRPERLRVYLPLAAKGD